LLEQFVLNVCLHQQGQSFKYPLTDTIPITHTSADYNKTFMTLGFGFTVSFHITRGGLRCANECAHI